MGSNRNRLLGLIGLEGAKWYVRRRLPSQRRVLLTGLVAGAAAAALVAILRRSS
jgi:hypothetical protein